MTERPIIAARAVSKAFFGNRVLNEVSIEIRPGTIHDDVLVRVRPLQLFNGLKDHGLVPPGAIWRPNPWHSWEKQTRILPQEPRQGKEDWIRVVGPFQTDPLRGFVPWYRARFMFGQKM